MPEGRHSSGAPWRNFYGRRHGKKLRPAQRAALERDLHASMLPGVDLPENPARRQLDLAEHFGDRPIWLEIGFGGGEHLIHQAEAHADIGLIGCEPFMNGVAMLLMKIKKGGVPNIRIHPGDARDLFDVLPTASIGRAFLLYPDPWPKTRHHRRRFVTAEHLEPLARAMAPGAELRIATDIADYVRQTLEEVPRAGFHWLAECPADWRDPWTDWPSTRYERKALRAGRRPHYLTFLRNP